jgi:hypothetical protein
LGADSLPDLVRKYALCKDEDLYDSREST